MQNIFVLCGNDGTGKTSLCQLINNSCGIAIERNSTNMFGLDPSIIDNMTLKYTWENEYHQELVNQITYDNILYTVYWLILDADIDTLNKRLCSRNIRDKWE